MTRRMLAAGAMMVLTLAALPAVADEDAGSHVEKAHKTILLGNERIVPADLTMSAGDAIEFQNLSLNSIRVEFIEPSDQADKIRCHLVGTKAGKAGAAPWALFSWGPGNHLTAIIPPGRFASVCSLAPGSYAFLTNRVGTDVRGGFGKAKEKGTITVQ